eukprot:3859861-Rhodomonas_salina.1
MVLLPVVDFGSGRCTTLPAYAPYGATLVPVLSQRMVLRVYWYRASVWCYACAGTEPAYGAALVL